MEIHSYLLLVMEFVASLSLAPPLDDALLCLDLHLFHQHLDSLQMVKWPCYLAEEFQVHWLIYSWTRGKIGKQL